MQQIWPAQGYAGDILPTTAYSWWRAQTALLIDIRSDAERNWVGYIEGAMALPWAQWPGMLRNPAFDQQLRVALSPEHKLLMLCRSGVRSIAAAKRATELGFEAYNILQGFEGDRNAQGQRNQLGGWRFHGLPWCQG